MWRGCLLWVIRAILPHFPHVGFRTYRIRNSDHKISR
jgi:hypothetical protein